MKLPLIPAGALLLLARVAGIPTQLQCHRELAAGGGMIHFKVPMRDPNRVRVRRLDGGQESLIDTGSTYVPGERFAVSLPDETGLLGQAQFRASSGALWEMDWGDQYSLAGSGACLPVSFHPVAGKRERIVRTDGASGSIRLWAGYAGQGREFVPAAVKVTDFFELHEEEKETASESAPRADVHAGMAPDGEVAQDSYGGGASGAASSPTEPPIRSSERTKQSQDLHAGLLGGAAGIGVGLVMLSALSAGAAARRVLARGRLALHHNQRPWSRQQPLGPLLIVT